MTKLTTSHPAVEAAMMEMTKGSGPLARTTLNSQTLNEALKVLEAALPHLDDVIPHSIEDDRLWEQLNEDDALSDLIDAVEEWQETPEAAEDGRNMAPLAAALAGWEFRRPAQNLPTGDGDVIVSLKEDEVIGARYDSGEVRSFRRLTFDKNTHTWYGMDVDGFLRWVRPAEIEHDTWKIEV